ncbi:MAG: hypothetical protein RL204_2342 [Bacteroidota bacterium]|jgi:hypothetical protein
MKPTNILLFVAIVFLSQSIKSQVFSNDPFKIDFDYFNIGDQKNAIQLNKVKSLSSYSFATEEDSDELAFKELEYKITFNEFGNPIHFIHQYTMPCWWWPRLKQKLKITEESITTYEYSFIYDSLQNLIQAKQNITESESSSHTENDIYYEYDNQSKLISETVSNKTIYKPGFTYRGNTYENDTNLNVYTFTYAANNRVAHAVRYCKKYYKWQNVSEYDTLFRNCTLDSIFFRTFLPQGIKVDSLGRVTEKTNFLIHATLMGGGSYYPNSPDDTIVTYFYDSNGNLLKSEARSRSGTLKRKTNWTYFDNGLLESIQQEHSRFGTTFEYEFYK